MRKQLSKIALTAGFMLAMSFTLSCSSDNDDGDKSNGSGTGVSSSSSVVSGSPSSSGGNSSSSAGGGSGGDVVNINGQVWMKKNLNVAAAGSKCYGDDPANCEKYGRLYDWATAMGLAASCNSSSCASQITPKHKGICPSNYHIPTNAEWDALLKYVDSQKGGEGEDGSCGTGTCYDSYTAGKYLKATSGWNSNGNGLDTYGFSALPGGYGNSDGNFDGAGNYGIWWSATEGTSNYAYDRYMNYYGVDALWNDNFKDILFSVRCLQD